MPLYNHSQLLALKILCSTIPPVVAIVTLARLWIKTPPRWGFDDLFVSVGVVFMILQQGILWTLSIYEPPKLPAFYIILLSSQTQIWSARFSLLASINRISPTHQIRVITKAIGGLFVLFYLVALGQFIWVCQTHLELINGVPHCAINRQIPIYQVTVAMIADSILIALPIRTLSFLSDDRPLRRRLTFIFAASITTTTVSFIQAVLNFKNIGFGVLIAVELECWVSLLVCNIGVVVTAIFNTCFWPSSRAPSYDISTLKFAPAPTETNIELQAREALQKAKGVRPQPSAESIQVSNKMDWPLVD